MILLTANSPAVGQFTSSAATPPLGVASTPVAVLPPLVRPFFSSITCPDRVAVDRHRDHSCFFPLSFPSANKIGKSACNVPLPPRPKLALVALAPWLPGPLFTFFLVFPGTVCLSQSPRSNMTEGFGGHPPWMPFLCRSLHIRAQNGAGGWSSCGAPAFRPWSLPRFCSRMRWLDTRSFAGHPLMPCSPRAGLRPAARCGAFPFFFFPWTPPWSPGGLLLGPCFPASGRQFRCLPGSFNAISNLSQALGFFGISFASAGQLIRRVDNPEKCRWWP